MRDLQFGSAFNRRIFYPYALVTANDMRLQGEAPSTEQRDRVWRYLVDGPMLVSDERVDLLAAVSPSDQIATFEWLFPGDRVTGDRRALWRYVRSVLRLNTGDVEGTREDLEGLVKELDAAKDESRVARTARQMLQELKRPAAPTARRN